MCVWVKVIHILDIQRIDKSNARMVTKKFICWLFHSWIRMNRIYNYNLWEFLNNSTHSPEYSTVRLADGFSSMCGEQYELPTLCPFENGMRVIGFYKVWHYICDRITRHIDGRF